MVNIVKKKDIDHFLDIANFFCKFLFNCLETCTGKTGSEERKYAKTKRAKNMQSLYTSNEIFYTRDILPVIPEGQLLL